jgi:uncharacterized protein (TIGR02246 family)
MVVTGATHTKQDDEIAIRELVQRWLDATEAGDLDTVLSLMADDVIFMVPGREPFGKETFAAQSKQMKDVRIEAQHEIQEIEVLDDRAWMRNHLTVTVAQPGHEPVTRSGYVLSILRKTSEGKWVLARDANLVM